MKVRSNVGKETPGLYSRPTKNKADIGEANKNLAYVADNVSRRSASCLWVIALMFCIKAAEMAKATQNSI